MMGEVLLGVACSFVAWFLVGVLIRPRVKLSPVILKSLSNKGRLQYRVKVENRGLICNVYDVALMGRLVVHNDVNGQVKLRYYNVQIGRDSHPFLFPARRHASFGESGREFLVRISDVARDSLSHRYDRPIETVEDALAASKSVELVISVICTHAFSGTRSVCTHRYCLEDIREGYFNNQGFGLMLRTMDIPEHDAYS